MVDSKELPLASCPESAWLDFLEQLEAHSFFVTPRWSRILERAKLGFVSKCLCGITENVEFLLPTMQRTNFGITQLFSMPFGTYGGPIVQNDVRKSNPAHGHPIFTGLRRNVLHLAASPGPYRHLEMDAIVIQNTTHVLDLTLTEKALMDGLASMTRRGIHQARHRGVSVRVDNSLDAFRVYGRMLQESSRRWGRKRPRYPWSLLRAICDEADGVSVRLWLADVHGETAAGAICFYGKQEVFYWSGAMFESLAHARPNNLLHWTILADAQALGYTQYNLGASDHLAGVRRFKEGFGARPLQYPTYILPTPVLRRVYPRLLALRREWLARRAE